MLAIHVSPLLADGVDGVGWASTIVALALLLLIGGVMIAAIKKYPKVDDALKVCGVLSGILGVVVGSFGTYFFTKQVVQAEIKAAQARIWDEEHPVLNRWTNGDAIETQGYNTEKSTNFHEVPDPDPVWNGVATNQPKTGLTNRGKLNALDSH